VEKQAEAAAEQTTELAELAAKIAFDLLTRSRQLSLRQTAYGLSERIAWMRCLPSPRLTRQSRETVRVLLFPTMVFFSHGERRY